MYDTVRSSYRIMVNTGCTLLSSSGGKAEHEEKTAASLIANWLRYRNNTGECALLVILIAPSSLPVFSPSLSLFCANIRTPTYVFHSAVHVCTRLTDCSVSPHDLLPNLLVWWELYHLVVRLLVFPISLFLSLSLVFLSHFHRFSCVAREMRVARRAIKLLHQRLPCAFNYRNAICAPRGAKNVIICSPC